MTDPRECDGCHAHVEHRTLAYELAIDANAQTIDFRARFCPRCAAAALRRRRFGDPDQWALESCVAILERRFGEPIRVTWLQGDHRRWAVLARRRDRPRPTEPQICAATPATEY